MILTIDVRLIYGINNKTIKIKSGKNVYMFCINSLPSLKHKYPSTHTGKYTNKSHTNTLAVDTFMHAYARCIYPSKKTCMLGLLQTG